MAIPFPSALRQPPWVTDLLRLLGPRPIPLDTLVATIQAQHPSVGREEVEGLLLTRATTHGTQEGWVDLLAAADGAILTHVLTADELRHGVLVADGDLDLWVRLAGGGLPLAGGGQVRARHRPDTVTGADGELVGPPGWLDGLREGQLIGVRLWQGVLEVLVVAPPALDRARARRLVAIAASNAWASLAAYLELREVDSGVEPTTRIGWAVADLVATCPGVLRAPLPPVPRLLELGGLMIHGSRASLPGLPADRRQTAALTDTEVRARVAVAAYARAWSGGGPVANQDGALFLDLAVVCGVLEHLADLVECDPLPLAALDGLRRLARTPTERAAVELLAARSAEGRGDAAAAEQLVTAALAHDPELLPAVLDAAEYAATRGDPVAAEGFLKRAGRPADDPRRVALAKVVPTPATAIARAQPCPCGSGERYRRCCLKLAVHPLPIRAGLVYARLAWYAYRAPRRGTVTWLERMVDLNQPHAGLLPLDLAIFDTGIIDDYLASRRELLPADERGLLERWRAARIAPYQVTKVRDEAYVTLRPLLGGEQVELRNRPLAASVRRYDVLVARVLHDGRRECLIAPARPVPLDRVAEVMAIFDRYQPQALAAFFGPGPAEAADDPCSGVVDAMGDA